MVLLLRKNQEMVTAFSKLNLDITELQDKLHKVISFCVQEIYGKDGLETFEWWCYDKNWGNRDDLKMYDGEKKEIPSKTIKDLHSFLKKEKKRKYTNTN